MSKEKIEIAISTCPNDTFAFHGLMAGAVEAEGIEFDFKLLDISQLNAGLLAGNFDIAKASFHAAILLADETVVLPSGSALGFGVGPLLLAANPDTVPKSHSQITMCPGAMTTATLLFKLFYPESTKIQQAIFSEIMPALKTNPPAADFGVCIHEGRFTWAEQGLSLVEDLGTRWEQETDSPLPLGGILARRNLPPSTIVRVQESIQASIKYGMAHRAETLPTMKKYAQEMDDAVVMAHVDLYVNDWTVDLRPVENSLAVLSKMAKRLGISTGNQDLEIFTLK